MNPDQVDELKEKAKKAREAFLRSEDQSRSEKQIRLLMTNCVVGWCDCLMVAARTRRARSHGQRSQRLEREFADARARASAAIR